MTAITPKDGEAVIARPVTPIADVMADLSDTLNYMAADDPLRPLLLDLERSVKAMAKSLGHPLGHQADDPRCEWCGKYAPSRSVISHRCSVTGQFEPYGGEW